MSSDAKTPRPRDAATRRRLASQPRRDTTPELRLRRELHARGPRYRVDHPIPIPRRRADIVFMRQRVAVFVDGCYWHGCTEHSTVPVTNANWWRRKLEANVARDRDAAMRLEAEGWLVLRFWEHEDAKQAAAQVERAVHARS